MATSKRFARSCFGKFIVQRRQIASRPIVDKIEEIIDKVKEYRSISYYTIAAKLNNQQNMQFYIACKKKPDVSISPEVKDLIDKFPIRESLLETKSNRDNFKEKGEIMFQDTQTMGKTWLTACK